jgi:hypothetical protein
VFAHCLVAEGAVLIGLSQRDWLRAAAPLVVPGAVALIVATPFWLPQILWLHAIKGDAALPLKFSETFLNFKDMVSPNFRYGIPIILASVVLVVGASRGRLSSRALMLLSVCTILLLVQTALIRPVTLHLPVVNLSQFVWRLMFPTAFVAFGVLLVMERGGSRWVRRGLGLLSTASVAFLAIKLTTSVASVAYYDAAKFSQDTFADASGVRRYFAPENVWGVGLFEPNYSDFEERCSIVNSGGSQVVPYTLLRKGVIAEYSYVVAKHAPIEFVQYYAAGGIVGRAYCNDSLILGPLPQGRTVSASENWLNLLQTLRILVLSLVATLCILIACRAYRRLRAASLDTKRE